MSIDRVASHSTAPWTQRSARPDPRPTAPPGDSERLRVAQVAQTTEARLQLTTDDGDVVTLTASREFEATYADYRQRSRGGEDTRIRMLAIEDSREVSFTVEGSLDAEEREEIAALVQRVSQGLRQFSKGNLRAAEAILQGGSYDALAGFSVEFERETTVTAGELLRRTASGGPPRAAEPLPVLPAPVEPTVLEPGPAQPAPDTEADGAATVADAVVRAAGKSRIASGRLQEVLGQLLQRLEAGADDGAPRQALQAVRAAFGRAMTLGGSASD